MLLLTHTYTVHINPGQKDPYENPVFVKEGFSWTAFVFTAFWGFYHRLWLPAVLMLVASAALNALPQMEILQPASVLALQLGYSAIIGTSANDWLRAGLRKRGYVTVDIVSGESLTRAEQRYFERHVERLALRGMAI